MKPLLLLALVLASACASSTTPRAATPRPVVVASPATTHTCGRPERVPEAAELLAVLPEAERRVVAVELAQLDGRGPWEALLLVNEGPVPGAVPKLYAFENVGGTWRLLDGEVFELSMRPAEDEGAVALRTAALLGPCHDVAWVDLEVSNWTARYEDAEGEFVKRSTSLLVLVDGRLEPRLTCDVAVRMETHDEERLIEGSNVTLAWSPDYPYPKPVYVRRQTGLASFMNLDEPLVVVDQEDTFTVEAWSIRSAECRR